MELNLNLLFTEPGIAPYLGEISMTVIHENVGRSKIQFFDLPTF
jgi:hypothetical protein